MRWKWKKKQQPKEGDMRIVGRFLLFPKCLNGEWRWLENAQIQQEYRPTRWFGEDKLPNRREYPTIWEWVDVCWNTFRDEPLG